MTRPPILNVAPPQDESSYTLAAADARALWAYVEWLETRRSQVQRCWSVACDRVKQLEAAYAGMMTRREVLERACEVRRKASGLVSPDNWLDGFAIGFLEAARYESCYPFADRLYDAAHELALLMAADREEAPGS